MSILKDNFIAIQFVIMIRSTLLLSGIVCAMNVWGQTPVIEWQTAIGGSATDRASHVRRTLDGGYLVTGHTMSNDGDVSGNHGGFDLWVVKLDRNGQFDWKRCYGGSGNDGVLGLSMDLTEDGGSIFAVATTSNDGDVTGFISIYDVWVVKLAANGDLQWEKCFGGSSIDRPNAIVQTGDGGYIVSGITQSPDGDVAGWQGGWDAWVFKIDAAGTLEWQRCYGGSDDDGLLDILLTGDGGYILCGYTSSTDGDVEGNHGGATDGWVVKLSTDGSIQWQQCFGGSEGDSFSSMRPSGTGGYILSGASDSNDGDVTGGHGARDVWVVKLNADGILEWQRCSGGSSDEVGQAIEVDHDGNYLVVGSTSAENGDVSGIHGGTDAWLINLDTNGELLWQKCFGGSMADNFGAIEVLNGVNSVVAGSSMSADWDVSLNQGQADMWIVKLSKEFNTIRGKAYCDLNGNGMHDPGEVLFGATKIMETTTGKQTFTQPSGEYLLSVVGDGTFYVQPDQILHYQAAPATQEVSFADVFEVATDMDFAYQPAGSVNDLQVQLTPNSPFRPGRAAHYIIRYRNVGTTTLAPIITFKPDPWLSFTGASIAPTQSTVDSVVWTMPDLAPFQEEQLLLSVMVSEGIPFSTTVHSIAQVLPVDGDAVPTDNTEHSSVLSIAAYDPNDIHVDPTSIGINELSLQPPLDYRVRFQNTGTDTAFTVIVKNPIPEGVDPSSILFLGASHPVVLDFDNEERILWFRFDDILLPDSNANEALSHGHIRYRILPDATLQVGDSILNQVSIFFDYNEPIYTNTASTVIESITAQEEIRSTDELLLFPNPTFGELTVQYKGHWGQADLMVMDAVGRVVLRDHMVDTSKRVMLGDHQAGVYTLTIRTEAGILTRRIILQ